VCCFENSKNDRPDLLHSALSFMGSVTLRHSVNLLSSSFVATMQKAPEPKFHTPPPFTEIIVLYVNGSERRQETSAPDVESTQKNYANILFY
jgi:hypothetical protein